MLYGRGKPGVVADKETRENTEATRLAASGIKNSQARAFPKCQLKPEYITSTMIPLAMGYDGTVVGCIGRKLAVTSDGFSTVNEGYDFDLEADIDGEYWVAGAMKFPAGYVVVLSSISAHNHSKVYFSNTISEGFSKVLTTDEYVSSLTISWYPGNKFEQIGLLGEYGVGASKNPCKLYLTTDGGETWAHILTTPAYSGDGYNTHFHHSIYDPYSGRIIASNGDGENHRKVRISDDMGATWQTITEGLKLPELVEDDIVFSQLGNVGIQPTLMIPFPSKVVCHLDRGTVVPGLYSLIRDKNFALQNSEEWKLKWEYSIFDGDNSGNHFGFQPYATKDSECYLVSPSNTDKRNYSILATGDAGETWHKVWGANMNNFAGSNFMNRGIVGIDASGYMYAPILIDGVQHIFKAKTVGWLLS